MGIVSGQLARKLQSREMRTDQCTDPRDCFVWEHCTNVESDDIDLNIFASKRQTLVSMESHTEGLYHEILGRTRPLSEGIFMHFKDNLLTPLHT